MHEVEIVVMENLLDDDRGRPLKRIGMMKCFVLCLQLFSNNGCGLCLFRVSQWPIQEIKERGGGGAK